MEGSSTLISIVIVTHGRPRVLSQCLDSLKEAVLQQRHFQFEVVIGINGPDDETARLISEKILEWQAIPFRFLQFPQRLTPSHGRNEALKWAHGDWVYFIDDDAFVSRDLFENFYLNLSQFPTAKSFGGPNLTPLKSTLFQQASGLALASRWGTAFSASRYKARKKFEPASERHLILCNLFIARDVLRDLSFPQDFLCCEENWLLQNLQSRGHLLVYAPNLIVWHERRRALLDFSRQIFKYGTGRGQFIRDTKTGFHPYYFIPSLCLIATLGVFISWLMTKTTNLVLNSPFLIYFTLCVFSGLKRVTDRTHPLKVVVATPFIFPVIHVAYGTGLVWGLVLTRKTPPPAVEA